MQGIFNQLLKNPNQGGTFSQLLQGGEALNPNFRNLLMAAGQAMVNRGQGFGQTYSALNAQTQADHRAGEEAKQAQLRSNQTANWLRSQGADPSLVQMAESGFGGRAIQLYGSTRNTVKKPSSVQEYEYAQGQGYDGSFQDYQLSKRKAGATNVTVGGGRFGTIPQGYELLETDQGARMQPIPGGPAALEQQKVDRSNQAAQQNASRYGNIVIEDIGRAKDTIKNGGFFNGAGATSLLTRHIPGTDGYKVASLIQTIKANAGFDKLQAMRDASPTGGALGQVSERELSFLQAAIGNLEQAQSEEELLYNLERVERIYDEIINGPQGGQPQQPPSAGAVIDASDYFK